MFVGGCGKAKMDATTEESFNKSVEEMKKPLDDAKKTQFEQALMMVSADAALRSAGKDAHKNVMAEIQGKTADEIIALGEKKKAEVMK
jgi:hypothetical protein